MLQEKKDEGDSPTLTIASTQGLQDYTEKRLEKLIITAI